MRAIMKYTLRDYIRSYLIVPPFAIFIIWTMVSYTYVPNPVFSSYAISCATLYFITAWLSINIMNTEESVQQQITIIHAKSFNKVFISKILSILFLTTILSIFAIMYPILIGGFNRSVTVADCLIVFVSLMLISLLSISVTIYFNGILKEQRTLSSWLMLVFLLFVSIVKVGIGNVLPNSITFLLWLLPPSFTILNILAEETILINGALLLKWVYVIFYTLILFFIFLRLKKSKGIY